MLDPLLNFLIVIMIGILASLLYDRFGRPAWPARQIKGGRRGTATGALVGIAGAFIGFHAAAILGLSGLHGLLPFLGAAIGAGLVLQAWRMIV
jgi:uncharacterized membrane protein YeaQ/YmgE (transglycosylase-associated protein family)